MKINFAWKYTPVMFVFSMALAGANVFADDANVSGARLTGALDLTYVGHLEKIDDDGRILVWEGASEGTSQAR